MVQMLVSHFLADHATRARLNAPQQSSVDFKASCHCHGRPVEYAFMCSVCLSLFCEPSDACTVCATPARGKATAPVAVTNHSGNGHI